jgi:hypothetical protein
MFKFINKYFIIHYINLRVEQAKNILQIRKIFEHKEGKIVHNILSYLFPHHGRTQQSI